MKRNKCNWKTYFTNETPKKRVRIVNLSKNFDHFPIKHTSPSGILD